MWHQRSYSVSTHIVVKHRRPRRMYELSTHQSLVELKPGPAACDLLINSRRGKRGSAEKNSVSFISALQVKDHLRLLHISAYGEWRHVVFVIMSCLFPKVVRIDLYWSTTSRGPSATFTSERFYQDGDTRRRTPPRRDRTSR